MLAATAATAQLSEIAHVGRGETGNFTMQIQLPRPGLLLSFVSLVAVVADDGRGGDYDDDDGVPLSRRSYFGTKNRSATTRRAVRGSRLPYHSPGIHIRDFLTASDATAPRFLLRFIAKSLRGGRRVPRLSLVFLLFFFPSSRFSFPSCFRLSPAHPFFSLSFLSLVILSYSLDAHWCAARVRRKKEKHNKNAAGRSAIKRQFVLSLSLSEKD